MSPNLKPQTLLARGLAVVLICVGSIARGADLEYVDLVGRLYDLRSLATPPSPGEKALSFSSYDRRSRFNLETNRYEDWGANQDSSGFLRREGSSVVAAEVDGPGVLWRSWSAQPGMGRIKVYIDGLEKPAIDMPFQSFFSREGPSGELFDYPELVRRVSHGSSNAVPIVFAKSCKIVLDKDWGQYYQFSFSQLPADVSVKAFSGRFSDADKVALLRANQAFANRAADPKASGVDLVSLEVPLSIGAGETIEAARIVGRRAISQIHLVIPENAALSEDLLRQLALSITWDEESSPAVWSPLGDFFGSGAAAANYRSLPVGKTDQGFYSYWFMPYEQSAVLRLENGSDATQSLKFRIVHEAVETDETLLRFHAKWHRDDFSGVDRRAFERGDRWPDWPILVTESRGRFCGVHLHAWNPNPRGALSKKFDLDRRSLPFRIYDGAKQAMMRQAWNEGDEKFFVDGAKSPSVFGVGTAAYFGYGRSDAPEAFDGALFGQPRNDGNYGHISNYRFQLADNVPFQSRFEGVIEKYQTNSWPLRYACTAYWYQAAGSKDPYGAVPAKERLGYFDQPEIDSTATIGLFEGESHFSKKPRARVQDMSPFGPGWSGGSHLLWDGVVGQFAEMHLDVVIPNTYVMELQLTEAPDYGVFEVLLDGQKIGENIDLYSDRVELSPLYELGEFQLKRGRHSLRFRLKGSNPKARPFRKTQYLLGVDFVRLRVK